MEVENHTARLRAPDVQRPTCGLGTQEGQRERRWDQACRVGTCDAPATARNVIPILFSPPKPRAGRRHSTRC